MSNYHERNTEKHEYEVQLPSGVMVFAGNVEKTAIAKAVETLSKKLEANGLRLYHTYPSPGPVRRYVGVVKRDGILHRAA
jgi:hypothetical protein